MEDLPWKTMFQYRKRYGLHAMLMQISMRLTCTGFNTASGMDCMQCHEESLGDPSGGVSIPQAVWIACNLDRLLHLHGFHVFQYRKRYGLHAISTVFPFRNFGRCFNTASGMDCMQSTVGVSRSYQIFVSIPQAVWIACNEAFSRLTIFQIHVSIPQAVWIACNTVPHSPWDS